MSGITLLDRVNSDITMDEQSSMAFRVTTTNPDGTPMDLTNGTVTWVADFNNNQQIKKDMPTLTVMLDAVPATTVASTAAAGSYVITVAQISGFSDPWGRPVANFAAGMIVNIVSVGGNSEVNTIASINNMQLTMSNPLVYTYSNGDAVAEIITSFTFQLLPGDTILPATKSYGTDIIYYHMAQVTYPAGLSPGNIYSVPTTEIVLRGRMFINPVLNIS